MNESRALLDTRVVIDLADIDIDLLPEQLFISTVTVAELAAGVHAARDVFTRAVRLRRLQWVESSFDPLPFDIPAAHCYAELFGMAHDAGRQPRRRVADLFIAAIAVANGMPLITRNHDDFSDLKSVVDVVTV